MYLWNWEGKTERNAVSALVGSSCDQSTCSDSDCCLRVVYFGIFFTCILWGSAESGWRRDCIPFCAFYRYGVSLPACPLSCSLPHKNPGLQIMSVAQSCPTLHSPMDCSLPGSSAHGIFQARVLEWGAMAFSEYSPYLLQIVNPSFSRSLAQLCLLAQHPSRGELGLNGMALLYMMHSQMSLS